MRNRAINWIPFVHLDFVVVEHCFTLKSSSKQFGWSFGMTSSTWFMFRMAKFGYPQSCIRHQSFSDTDLNWMFVVVSDLLVFEIVFMSSGILRENPFSVFSTFLTPLKQFSIYFLLVDWVCPTCLSSLVLLGGWVFQAFLFLLLFPNLLLLSPWLLPSLLFLKWLPFLFLYFLFFLTGDLWLPLVCFPFVKWVAFAPKWFGGTFV